MAEVSRRIFIYSFAGLKFESYVLDDLEQISVENKLLRQNSAFENKKKHTFESFLMSSWGWALYEVYRVQNAVTKHLLQEVSFSFERNLKMFFRLYAEIEFIIAIQMRYSDCLKTRECIINMSFIFIF